MANSGAITLPSLADPLTFGSGGMFDGNTFSRLVASTFAEDNYLKIMMVGFTFFIVHFYNLTYIFMLYIFFVIRNMLHVSIFLD